MEQDHTLDELLGMLRTAVSTTTVGDCRASGMERGKECKFPSCTCAQCQTALIDAIEQAALHAADDEYTRGFDEGFASADDWMVEHAEDMERHGWYRALDADGEVIHAYDELFSGDGESCGRVTAIGVGERKGLVWVLKEGKSVSNGVGTLFMHHHRQPTVEDVLCQLIDAVDDDRYGQDKIIAEFAPRLRLAGDAE